MCSCLCFSVFYFSFFFSSLSSVPPSGKAKSSHHLDDCSTWCCHLKPWGNLSHFVIFSVTQGQLTTEGGEIVNWGGEEKAAEKGWEKKKWYKMLKNQEKTMRPAGCFKQEKLKAIQMWCEKQKILHVLFSIFSNSSPPYHQQKGAKNKKTWVDHRVVGTNWDIENLRDNEENSNGWNIKGIRTVFPVKDNPFCLRTLI